MSQEKFPHPSRASTRNPGRRNAPTISSRHFVQNNHATCSTSNALLFFLMDTFETNEWSVHTEKNTYIAKKRKCQVYFSLSLKHLFSIYVIYRSVSVICFLTVGCFLRIAPAPTLVHVGFPKLAQSSSSPFALIYRIHPFAIGFRNGEDVSSSRFARARIVASSSLPSLDFECQIFAEPGRKRGGGRGRGGGEGEERGGRLRSCSRLHGNAGDQKFGMDEADGAGDGEADIATTGVVSLRRTSRHSGCLQ